MLMVKRFIKESLKPYKHSVHNLNLYMLKSLGRKLISGKIESKKGLFFFLNERKSKLNNKLKKLFFQEQRTALPMVPGLKIL